MIKIQLGNQNNKYAWLENNGCINEQRERELPFNTRGAITRRSEVENQEPSKTMIMVDVECYKNYER